MNRNSALIWLPVVEKEGLPTPKTIVIPYDHHAVAPIFDGESCVEFERLASAVDAACDEFPGPVFLRTDLGSAKHSGPKAYKVDDEPSSQTLFRLLEDQEMKFWMEREGPQAILVRQFLNLESRFEAFHGLPVNREFRIFSAGLHRLCAHPYWPHHAIEDHVDESKYPRWRDDLASLQAEPAEMDSLKAMADRAVLACIRESKKIQFWSVDFAQDVDGKWWLIDMAVMQDSYHWPDCDLAKHG